MTLKLFPRSKLRTLWIRKFPLENEDFPIIILVLTGCRSLLMEFKTAATRLDFSDLNEILLKKKTK